MRNLKEPELAIGVVPCPASDIRSFDTALWHSMASGFGQTDYSEIQISKMEMNVVYASNINTGLHKKLRSLLSEAGMHGVALWLGVCHYDPMPLNKTRIGPGRSPYPDTDEPVVMLTFSPRSPEKGVITTTFYIILVWLDRGLNPQPSDQ